MWNTQFNKSSRIHIFFYAFILLFLKTFSQTHIPITQLPVKVFLDTCTKPPVINIPKAVEGFNFITTIHGEVQKIKLKPPEIIPLSMLKNQENEVINDINGNPFILGENGGYTYMQNYNTEQGLSMSSIPSSCLDHIGNLWFGTNGGG